MKNCLVTTLKANTGNFDLPRVGYVVGRIDSQFTPSSSSTIKSVYHEDCDVIIKGEGNFLDGSTLQPFPSPNDKKFGVFAWHNQNPMWLSAGKYQVLFPKEKFGGIVDCNVPLFIDIRDLYTVNFKNSIFVRNINGTMQEIINLAKNKNKPLLMYGLDISMNTEQLKDITIAMPFQGNPNIEGDISNIHFYKWESDINMGVCPKLYGSVEVFFDEHINRLNLSTQEGYFYSEANGITFNGIMKNMWYYTISEYGNCKIYSDSDRQNLAGTYSKETRQWTYQS